MTNAVSSLFSQLTTSSNLISTTAATPAPSNLTIHSPADSVSPPMLFTPSLSFAAQNVGVSGSDANCGMEKRCAEFSTYGSFSPPLFHPIHFPPSPSRSSSPCCSLDKAGHEQFVHVEAHPLPSSTTLPPLTSTTTTKHQPGVIGSSRPSTGYGSHSDDDPPNAHPRISRSFWNPLSPTLSSPSPTQFQSPLQFHSPSQSHQLQSQQQSHQQQSQNFIHSQLCSSPGDFPSICKNNNESLRWGGGEIGSNFLAPSSLDNDFFPPFLDPCLRSKYKNEAGDDEDGGSLKVDAPRHDFSHESSLARHDRGVDRDVNSLFPSTSDIFDDFDDFEHSRPPLASHRQLNAPMSPFSTSTILSYADGFSIQNGDLYLSASTNATINTDDTATASNNSSPSSARKEKGKIPTAIDWSLLLDIPAWLRSLRLHKYTHIFLPSETHVHPWTWQEMVQLSDDDLVDLGVAALGARRKMMRVFEMIREERE